MKKVRKNLIASTKRIAFHTALWSMPIAATAYFATRVSFTSTNDVFKTAAQKSSAFNNSVYYSPDSSKSLSFGSHGNQLDTNTPSAQTSVKNVNASDINVGDVITKGSLSGLGVLQALTLSSLQIDPISVYELSLYDVNNQRISWSIDPASPNVNAWEKVGKSSLDTVTQDLGRGVNNNLSIPLKYQDKWKWYKNGNIADFVGAPDNNLHVESTEHSFESLQFRIILDQPAIVDHIQYSGEPVQFINVIAETPNNNIFYMSDSDTKTTVSNKQVPVANGAWSSIAKARGQGDDFIADVASNANNHIPWSEVDSHRLPNEWGTTKNYFGLTDDTKYTWKNISSLSPQGNLGMHFDKSKNDKLVSYYKPGYQTLFIKDSNPNIKLQPISGDSNLVGAYPEFIPTVKEVDGKTINYGWINVSPGDAVHMYFVKNDFDFLRIFDEKTPDNKLLSSNIKDYKQYITQANIIDPKKENIYSPNGEPQTRISFDPTASTGQPTYIDWDPMAIDQSKLFTGVQYNYNTKSALMDMNAVHLNYEALNLPKDSAGNFTVGAYIMVSLSYNQQFIRQTYANGPWDSAGDSLNNEFKLIDFNVQRDNIFAIQRESTIKMMFVPLDGYKFDKNDAHQVKEYTISYPNIPWTQMQNPMLGYDSVVGDLNRYTSQYSLMGLGKIKSAKLNFRFVDNLYNIKFIDASGQEIPYKITNFDGNINSSTGDDVQFSDYDLDRLTSIYRFDAATPDDWRQNATNIKYTQWNTVDGNQENEKNVFYPITSTSPRTMRIEFSFPVAKEIDHITFAGDNENMLGTSLDWAQLKNNKNNIYEATQIGYSPSRVNQEFRTIELNQNGNALYDEHLSEDKMANYVDAKGNASSKVFKTTHQIYWGNSLLDWKASNNEATIKSKIQDLGEITEGRFSIYAPGLSDDYSKVISALNGLEVYDENGAKLKYKVTAMQGLGTNFQRSTNLWSYFGNYEATPPEKGLAVFYPKNLDTISDALQDGNVATSAFDENQVIKNPNRTENNKEVSEIYGLGRYEAGFSFRWTFEDGQAHKIGYIKTSSTSPDQNLGQDLSTWGNYATRLGMSFLSSDGQSYLIDSIQGKKLDKSAPDSMRTQKQRNTNVTAFDSYFGKDEELQFQKNVFQIGDHLHLNSINHFFSLKDRSILRDSSSNFNNQEYTTWVANSRDSAFVDSTNFVLNSLNSLTFRVQSYFTNFSFMNNGFKPYVQMNINPSQHMISRDVVVPDEIKNFTGFAVTGTNGNASININSLKFSNMVDVVFRKGDEHGNFSTASYNIPPDDLKNNDVLEISILPKQGVSLVDKGGKPIVTELKSLFTISNLPASQQISVSGIPPATISVSGSNSLAKVSLPQSAIDYFRNNNISFWFTVARNGVNKTYTQNQMPNDIRNGDVIHLNISANSGYVFVKTNGTSVDESKTISDKEVSSTIAGLPNPSFVALPSSDFNLISQNLFVFDAVANSNEYSISNQTKAFDTLNKLSQNPNIEVKFEIFNKNSIVPVKTPNIIDSSVRFLENQILKISVTPKHGSVFGDAQNYLTQPQSLSTSVVVIPNVVNPNNTIPYFGELTFPKELVFSGSIGAAKVNLNAGGLAETDTNFMFSYNTYKLNYKAYLYRADDLSKKIVSLPGSSDYFDGGQINASAEQVVTSSTPTLFDNLNNGDVIYIVASKGQNETWINSGYAGDKPVQLPKGNSYFQMYTISNLKPKPIVAEDLLMPKFNLGFVGQDGNVRIVPNGTSDPSKYTSLISKEGLFANPDISVDFFRISAFTDPNSALFKSLPVWKDSNSPYAPYTYWDGFSSNQIPDISAINADDFIDQVKSGSAPWIQRIDPFKNYDSLPLFSDDYLVIWVRSKNNDTAISNNLFNYFKIVKVPKLLKTTEQISIPSDSKGFISGTDGNGYFIDDTIKYDNNEVDLTVKITDKSGQVHTFDHVPKTNEYNTLSNGDKIEINAFPKSGYWWGDSRKPNDKFADSEHFAKLIDQLSGLAANIINISYKPLVVTKDEFIFSGTNSDAIIKIKPGSDLDKELKNPNSDYSIFLKLTHQAKDGKITTVTEFVDPTNYIAHPDSKFLSKAVNGDSLSAVYMAKSPKTWTDAPNNLIQFETNSIPLDWTPFALNVYADGLVPKDLITKIIGTFSPSTTSPTGFSGHLKVNVPSVDQNIGTITLEIVDQSNNHIANIAPNTYVDVDNFLPPINLKNSSTIPTTYYKIRATLTPNHANNYWVTFNDTTQKAPDTDFNQIDEFITTDEVQEYADPSQIIDEIDSQIFNDYSNFNDVFKGAKGIDGKKFYANIDAAKLTSLMTKFQSSSSIFDIAIDLILANPSAAETPQQKWRIYSSSGKDTISNIFESKNVNDSWVPIDNLNATLKYEITLKLKKTVVNKTLDKDGKAMMEFTSPTKVAGSADVSQNKDDWKLWDLFNVKNVIDAADLAFPFSNTRGTFLSDPIWLSNKNMRDDVDANVLKSWLFKLVDDGAIIELISQDPMQNPNNKNKIFVYSKTKQEFAIQSNTQSLSLTFAPGPENNNQSLSLGKYNFKVSFPAGTAPDKYIKFYDDDPIFGVLSKDITQDLNLKDVIEVPESFEISNRYIPVTTSVSSDITLMPNGISGSGKLDLQAMKFPAQPDPNYAIKVIVYRGGNILKAYDDVTATTNIDSLAVGDRISVTAEIRLTSWGRYIFATKSTSINLLDKVIADGQLKIAVNIPTPPTLQQLGLAGISGKGIVKNMNLLSIPHTTYEMYVQKSGGVKTKTNSLDSLENGDTIFIDYKIASTAGGYFVDAHGTKTPTYEIPYSITGLNTTIASPNLKPDYVRFKAVNGKLVPVIDWKSIFINNYPIGDVEVNIKLFDKDHKAIALQNPSDPSDKNWLQNIDISDLWKPAPIVQTELSKLSLATSNIFRLEIVAKTGHEFTNFQGKMVSSEVQIDDATINKTSIDLSAFDFINNQSLDFVNPVSGFATIDSAKLNFDDLIKLPIKTTFTIKDGLNNVKGTFVNALPTHLVNGDAITMNIEPIKPLENSIKYNSVQTAGIVRTWSVLGLKEQINNPTFSNPVTFTKYDGLGRAQSLDFGDPGKGASYIYQYQVKHKGAADFSKPVKFVADLSNGDKVKIIVIPSDGYAFVDSSEKEIPSFTSPEYTVSGLIVKKNFTLPSSLIMSATYDEQSKKYSNLKIQNIATNELENDSDMKINFTIGGQSFSKWKDIPENLLTNGAVIDIKINANPGVVFDDDSAEQEKVYRLNTSVVSIPNLDEIKSSPFVVNANNNFDFRMSLLPNIPGFNYYFLTGGQDGTPVVVSSPTDLKPGTNLTMTIKPTSGMAVIFDQKLGNGTLTFTTPLSGSKNATGIDMFLPNDMLWTGEDGKGTINAEKLKPNIFVTKDVKFTFKITSKNTTRIAYSLADLNLHNGDEVEVVAQATSGKLFADNNSLQSKIYEVYGLINKKDETAKSAIYGTVFAASGAGMLGFMGFNQSKIRKWFSKKK